MLFSKQSILDDFNIIPNILLDIRETNGKPPLLPLNQRLTWKVRLAKLCLSCLRTLVFCLLLDCIHAHSKCILRMNALLWFLYMLSNFDGKTYIPYQQNINKYISTYLLMLYLLILYTHSSISLQMNISYSKYEHPQLLWWKIMCITVSQQLIVVVFWNDRLENFLLTSTASITNWPKFLNVLLYHWSLFYRNGS